MLCASHVIVVISSSDACDEALLWTRPLYQL